MSQGVVALRAAHDGPSQHQAPPRKRNTQLQATQNDSWDLPKGFQRRVGSSPAPGAAQEADHPAAGHPERQLGPPTRLSEEGGQ